MSVSDTTLTRIGRACGAFAVIATFAGLTWLVVGGHWEQIVNDFVLEIAVVALGFGAFLWLVVPAEPRNLAVWAPGLGAVFGGLYILAEASVMAFVTSAGIDSSQLASMVVADVFERVDDLAVVPLIVLLVSGAPTFFMVIGGLVFFPNGRLPSPKWKWLLAIAVADLIVVSAGIAWAFRPDSDLLIGADLSDVDGLARVLEPATIVLLLAGVGSVSSLFVRFRRSDETARHQLRWIMWGGSALIVGLGAELIQDAVLSSSPNIVSQIPTIVGELALVGSYAVAITRYRLYDVDVVISKTFVYAVLAGFIGGVYVAIVVGVGLLFGGGSDPNPVLAVAATAIVAVAFQPLRTRLQKVANKIVYGKRATPYEVLSEFSRQVAATDESLLEPVARFLTEGTAASGAAIWTIDDGRMKQLSAWPEDETPPEPVRLAHTEDLNFPGADVVLPITHDEDLLGALTLALPQGQELNRNDEALADELTAGMGLALRNIQLTRALEDRVVELRESRRRIVAVQDETRRRLERDLHDGAQQRLVALKVKLALAGELAARDDAASTVGFLADLSEQADEAVAVLREFARGVYPPLLEAEGLGSALPSAVDRLPIAVDVAAEGIGRYPKDVEATTYFCVLEALHNVVKFSGASSAQVMLADDEGGLRFEVRDAGSGFDPERVEFGSGLQNIRDRMDAAGGTFTITTSPGRGTVIGGTLPVRDPVAT